MSEKKFEVIPGGRDGEPPQSKQDLQDEIDRTVNRRSSLSPEEVRQLLDTIRTLEIRTLRENIARYSDRILPDEDLVFIKEHMIAFTIGSLPAKKELYERFPHLVGYFDSILTQLNLNQ